MAGLQRKYLRMAGNDFKKAWALQKSGGRRTSRTEVKTIAKKRRFGGFKKAYKKVGSKSMSVFGVNVMDDLVYPGAYGALRPKVASYVLPYTDQLPVINTLGGKADNVGMILALALASKFIGGKVPIVRQLARNGIKIEAAFLGQEIATGGSTGTSTSW